jgi:hypothetical protein
MAIAAPAAAQPGEKAGATAKRPAGTTLGFGFGWFLPTDVTVPNTVSVRLRLPNGLTFEPTTRFSYNGQTDENAAGTEDKTTSTDITLGTLVRVPLGWRGPIDLSVVGSGFFSLLKTDFDPAGGGGSVDKTTAFSLGWGVAIDWWFKRHWSFSFTAINPAFSYTRNATEFGGAETSSTSTLLGAIWDPSLFMMTHLYY